MSDSKILSLSFNLGKLSGTVSLDGQEIAVEPFYIGYGTTLLEKQEVLVVTAEKYLSYSTWVHERSALVHLMLQEGMRYILCKGSDSDKDFDKFDGNIVVINGFKERHLSHDIVFIDVNGEEWQAAQPIKPNGYVMGYDDYLKLKGIL